MFRFVMMGVTMLCVAEARGQIQVEIEIGQVSAGTAAAGQRKLKVTAGNRDETAQAITIANRFLTDGETKRAEELRKIIDLEVRRMETLRPVVVVAPSSSCCSTPHVPCVRNPCVRNPCVRAPYYHPYARSYTTFGYGSTIAFARGALAPGLSAQCTCAPHRSRVQAALRSQGIYEGEWVYYYCTCPPGCTCNSRH